MSLQVKIFKDYIFLTRKLNLPATLSRYYKKKYIDICNDKIRNILTEF